MIVTIPLQLSYLNAALKHFEAQFVVPALQAFWSLSSITTGALSFNEFAVNRSHIDYALIAS